MKSTATEARPYELIAVIGDDGAVIAMGVPSGAQGGMSELGISLAESMKKYLDWYVIKANAHKNA